MHETAHLIPGNDSACPVGAENRGRRIAHIQFGIIAGSSDDCFGIFAGDIAAQSALQSPRPAGIGCHLLHVAPQRRDRDDPPQHSVPGLF